MAIVTISRGSMSGGQEFAECLARRLGYPTLAREILVQAAERLNVAEDLLRGKIERSAGFWERMTSDRRIYLVALQSALADACVSGNLVYHGHAGHLLLKNVVNVLRVRLIAPVEARIRAVIERQGLDPEAAREYIRTVDEERVRWTEFVYGVDWRDPQNYDLVVNLGNMTIETACAMVAGTVSLPAYETTDEVRRTLGDFALACRVKVALAATKRWRTVAFDVTARDGVVEILGEMAGGVLVRQAGPDRQDIELVARTVEGVRDVRVSLRRFPEFGDA